MKIDRVIYGSTVPTVQFGNQRPGFEASLEPGEDPVEAYLKLHKIAMKAVGEVVGQEEVWEKTTDMPPHQKTQVTFAPTSIPTRNIEEERKEVMDTIDKCETLEQLKAWKSQNQTVPGKILTHYNNRLQQLTK
jgi:hypothetical protein